METEDLDLPYRTEAQRASNVEETAILSALAGPSIQPSPEALVVALLQETLRSSLNPHVSLQVYLKSPHIDTVAVSPEVLDELIVAETINRLRDRTQASVAVAVALQGLRQKPRVVTEEQKQAADSAFRKELLKESLNVRLIGRLIEDFDLDLETEINREAMKHLLWSVFKKLSPYRYAELVLTRDMSFIPGGLIKEVGLEILPSRIFDLAAGKETNGFTLTPLPPDQIVDLLDVNSDELKNAAIKAVSTVAQYADGSFLVADRIISDYSLDETEVQQAVVIGLTEAIERFHSPSSRTLRIKAVLDHFCVTPTADLVKLGEEAVSDFLQREWFDEAREIVTAFNIVVDDKNVAKQLNKRTNRNKGGGGF